MPPKEIPALRGREEVNALLLGGRAYDLTTRTLVMGILNPTPDSVSEKGAPSVLDALLRRAERLVTEGADILDVGGMKAGPGPEVGEAEELDRVVPAVEAVAARFDVPVSVGTWRAAVLDAACRAGAVCGHDVSGFADPAYLPTASRHRAAVVATHTRLRPRVPDPHPVHDDLVEEVCAFLAERAGWALRAGIPAVAVVLDAGLDLGKTAAQSAVLVRESHRLAALGHPLLLSVSNKSFLGVLLDQAIDQRHWSSLAATAYGVARGVRIVRVHDVAGTVRVVRTVEALLEPGS
jgi:dihydropteroate synthase